MMLPSTLRRLAAAARRLCRADLTGLSRRAVLWSVVVCAAGAAASPPAPDRKKGHKAAEPVLCDDRLPHPDALPAPLTPQAQLPDDFTLSPEPRDHKPNRRLGGIDVSHYQGQINWREVARSGEVHYVYLKATEGAQLVDNTFRTNLQGARQAGFKVGIYHFYRPTAGTRQQLKNLTANVARRDMDLVPIIDVEHRGKQPLAVFQQELLQFCRLVERHYGVQPIIYTSRDFYNKHLAGPFTGYRYMIARYHTEVPRLCDEAAFMLWQYTANGRLPGIRGNVDRSCFMDNYQLRDILLP